MVTVTKSDIGRRVRGKFNNIDYVGKVVASFSEKIVIALEDLSRGPHWEDTTNTYGIIDWGKFAEKGNLYLDEVDEFLDEPSVTSNQPPPTNYIYKEGDTIEFLGTKNTRNYNTGKAIGFVLTLSPSESNYLNRVEGGIVDSWCTDENLHRTNFRKGDVRLVTAATKTSIQPTFKFNIGDVVLVGGQSNKNTTYSLAGLFTKIRDRKRVANANYYELARYLNSGDPLIYWLGEDELDWGVNKPLVPSGIDYTQDIVTIKPRQLGVVSPLSGLNYGTSLHFTYGEDFFNEICGIPKPSSSELVLIKENKPSNKLLILK